jgi:hypothetical protein
MSGNTAFLKLDIPCNEAVDWVSHRLSQAGLEVLRTFDLQVARPVMKDCPCPHHGTDQCDCQMVVLLVYPASKQPVSMIAHGYNGQTWFSVVDTPQQRADPDLEAIIQRVLISAVFPPLNVDHQAHAI